MENKHFNKKEITLTPQFLEDDVIKLYTENINFRYKNFKFKGFLEFENQDSEVKNFYYGIFSKNHDKIYLAIRTFEYEDSIDREELNIKNFLKNKARDYNRNSSNNVSYNQEEIKDLLLPNVNIDNIQEYCKEFKYLIYFPGYDDGSIFLRFNSEEKRDKFLETLTKFEKFDDLFNYEEEDLVLFYFN